MMIAFEDRLKAKSEEVTQGIQEAADRLLPGAKITQPAPRATRVDLPPVTIGQRQFKGLVAKVWVEESNEYFVSATQPGGSGLRHPHVSSMTESFCGDFYKAEQALTRSDYTTFLMEVLSTMTQVSPRDAYYTPGGIVQCADCGAYNDPYEDLVPCARRGCRNHAHPGCGWKCWNCLGLYCGDCLQPTVFRNQKLCPQCDRTLRNYYKENEV